MSTSLKHKERVLHVKWLKNLKAKLLAPWTRQAELKELQEMTAGLLLELARNGNVLKRFEEELSGLLLQVVEQGLSNEEMKETIAFMLMEIAKEEKR